MEIYTENGGFLPGPALLQARANAACGILPGGRVVVLGGTDGIHTLASAEVFDPVEGGWAAFGSMAYARAGHTVTPLPWGDMLITGGESTGAVEVLDANGRFTVAGTLSVPRQGFALAVLPDRGQVLIAGGSDGEHALNTIDIFSAVNNSVTPAGAMIEARRNFAASTLLDGTVLMTGGYAGDGSVLKSTEIFDPNSRVSSPGPDMAGPRANHEATTLIDNGSVLLTGGTDGASLLASTDLFPFWAHRFVPAATMNVARFGASELQAMRGELMIVGGQNRTEYQPGSEIYRFATISSDQAVYRPGDMARFTGSGWNPGEQVQLTLGSFAGDAASDAITTSAIADDAGRVTFPSVRLDLNPVARRYLVSAAGTQSVAQLRALVKVTPQFTIAPNPATPTAGVPFSVTVTANPTNNSSTVTLKGLGSLSGQVLDNNGQTTFTNLTSIAGNPATSLQVQVGAFDPNFIQGLYPTPGQPLVVNQAPTSVSVSFTPSSVNQGQQITYNATVNVPANEVLTVTGTLNFNDGTNNVTVPVANGQASTGPLVAGPSSVTVTYSGDSNFFTSNNSVAVPVILTPQFSLQVNPATPTAGLPFSVTITATQVNGQLPTGQITLLGITGLSSVTLQNGQATYSNLTLPGGNPATTLQVQLASDPVFINGTYLNQALVVAQAQSTTVASVSPNPYSFGQTVTYNATVTPPANDVLAVTGTVNFNDGTNNITVALVNGQASSGSLVPGAGPLVATYGGDKNFLPSNFTLPLSPTPDTTTTTLTATPNPSPFGVPDVLTATVTMSPNVGNPTGTVTIRDAGLNIGCENLPLSAANPATNATVCAPSFQTAGPHSIIATYTSNSPNITSSASLPLPVIVNPVTPFFTLLVNPAIPSAGVPFSVTVTAIPFAGKLPTVPIKLLGVGNTSGQVLQNGSTTFSNLTAAAGGATLQVQVPAGDPVFAAGTYLNQPLTVIPASTTVSATLTPNPISFGQKVVYNATVNPPATDVLTPTGTVTFQDGTNSIQVALVNGKASTSQLTPGAGPLLVTYAGDSNFLPSSSSLTPITIVPDTTTTALSASNNPVLALTPTTLTATITMSPNVGNPTGTVSIRDNGASIGCDNLPLTATNPATNATTCTASFLTTGSHSLVATYTSNSVNIIGSSSAALNLSVNAAAAAGASVNPNPLILVSYVGDPSPVSGTLFVAANTSTFTVTSPVSWLTATANTNAATVTVTYNPAQGPGTGIHDVLLHFAFPDGSQLDSRVQVQVLVIQLRSSASSLTFTAPEGSTTVLSQLAGISATSKNVPVTITTTVTSPAGGAWLSAGPQSATSTPFTLQAQVDPSGLKAGTYQGTILLAASAATNSPFSISVTLTITPVSTPAITIASVVNAAGMLSGPAAPNTILTAFGTFPGCSNAQVLIDGGATDVFYSSPTQINFLVPARVSGETSVSLQISCAGLVSSVMNMTGAGLSPAIFTAAVSGTGQAAIVNQDGHIGPPTPAGTYIQVYVTGFGLFNNAGADGLKHLAQTVTATVGGVSAIVLYAGEAPGYTAGLQQINVLIPAGMSSGQQALVLTIGGQTTQAGVTIAIQ